MDKIEQRLEVLEKKIDILLSYLENILQFKDYDEKIIGPEQILAMLQSSATSTKGSAGKKFEKLPKEQTDNSVTNYKHLTWTGKSYANGLDYFKLKNKVVSEIWRQIADFFDKIDKDSEIADAQAGYVLGYVTTVPEKVDQLLDKILEGKK